MCTSPLVRYRLKRSLSPVLSAKYYLIKQEIYTNKDKGFRIIGKKKLEKLFENHSQYLSFMNAYCDYIEIPCGQCDECKKSYARDWSVRCYHESLMHKNNCFITLTIDNLANKKFMQEIEKSYKNGTNRYCKYCQHGNKFFNFPIDYSLNKVFIMDWLKKFRDYLYRNYKISIRYFGCGEYGSLNERPHYHFLIFGYNFPPVVKKDGTTFNKFPAELSKKNVQMYISEELNYLWQYGKCYVEELNMSACLYVAKYCMKKIKFFDSEKLYDYYYGRVPEFLLMSKGNCQVNRCQFIDDIIANKALDNLRDLNNPYCKNCNKTRGGIGFNWLWKYINDVRKLQYIVIEGRKYPIPKYYKNVIKLTDLILYDKLKTDSIYYVETELENHPDKNSTESCKKRKVINKKRLSFSQRDIV